VKLIVRGKAFRAAEKLAPAAFLQYRYPLHRVLEHRHELLVHMALDLLEGKVIGYAPLPPRHGVRFECADHQAARVLAVIGATIVVAHHRQVMWQIIQLLSHRVVVFTGVQRHADARHTADFTAPKAAAVDDEIRRNLTLVGDHAADPSIGLLDAGDAHTLEAQGAASSRTLDEGLGHIDRARGAILLDPGCAQQIAGFEVGINRLRLLRGNDIDARHPEGVVHRRDPLQLLEARLAVRDRQRADLLEPGRLPGLHLEFLQDRHRVLAQACMRLVGAHGADQPGRMPGGAATELDALQQHDVSPAEFCEMVGDAGTDDAATDDDRGGAFGNCL